MNVNGVTDIVFLENYQRKVNAIVIHNVNHHVTNVLSRTEMILLREADYQKENGGDPEPLYKVIRQMRETFMVNAQPPEVNSEPIIERTLGNSDELADSEVTSKPSTAAILSFDKFKR